MSRHPPYFPSRSYSYATHTHTHKRYIPGGWYLVVFCAELTTSLQLPHFMEPNYTQHLSGTVKLTIFITGPSQEELTYLCHGEGYS